MPLALWCSFTFGNISPESSTEPGAQATAGEGQQSCHYFSALLPHLPFCPENGCRTVLLMLYHPAWRLSLCHDLSTAPTTFSVTNVEMVIDQINDRDIQIMRRTPTVDGHYKLWKIKYSTERKSREEEKR